jgi:hypothetical protein
MMLGGFDDRIILEFIPHEIFSASVSSTMAMPRQTLYVGQIQQRPNGPATRQSFASVTCHSPNHRASFLQAEGMS